MRRIALAVMIVGCLAWALPARAQTERTVSTTGEATVYVVPDRVVVNVGIETFAADLDAATASNEAAGRKLVQAVLGLGVEKRDVATDRLQVDIHRRFENGRYLDIEGYFVRRGYAITLKDVTRLERLADTALRNGANQIQDVTFSTTQLRKYRDQARQMAIRAAREKAVLLARELDCTVGKPRTINDSGANVYFGGYRWDRGGSMTGQNAVQLVAGPRDTGEALPLGQIAVSASVSVTFDMQ